jgi:hypothetical protein
MQGRTDVHNTHTHTHTHVHAYIHTYMHTHTHTHTHTFIYIHMHTRIHIQEYESGDDVQRLPCLNVFVLVRTHTQTHTHRSTRQETSACIIFPPPFLYIHTLIHTGVRVRRRGATIAVSTPVPHELQSPMASQSNELSSWKGGLPCV